MVAVIGDIHGCYHTLRELVKITRKKYPEISLYSVGDLVDRGKFSYEVIEYVISENIRFTPGNHDYMFYYFIKEPTNPIGRSWLYNGSESTVVSYQNRLEKITEHLELIINAPLFINLEDCFISHAGISSYYQSKFSPDIINQPETLESILRSDIAKEWGVLWSRDDLMNIGKLQLVGHTRQQKINYYETNNVAYIDTSVYTGNKLSAVIVDQNTIVDSFSVPTFKVDIE
ncbi:MAG: metallophosphoesterase family protein [Ignavibacteriaceae bacterium]